MLAAERIEQIAQLESEIETRRVEINRLQIDTMKGQAEKYAEECKDESYEPDIQSESLRKSLGELIVIWEQRLGENRSGIKKISTKAQLNKDNPATTTDGNTSHTTNLDDPPAMVYTTSWESDDEISEASTDVTPNPSSPRQNGGLIEHLLRPFGSLGRNVESTAELDVLERMVEERDLKIESLQAVISTDTEIIEKMKNAIEKMVGERKEAHTLQTMAGELGSTISLQGKKHESIKEACVILQSVLTDMETRSSSQEDVIEFLKAETVKLLVTKRMVEEDLSTELERRDIMISNLKKFCRENADQSQRMITFLESCGSSLEDEIEELKAENVRLRVRSEMLEEEKRMVEQEMRTELQLLYIENSRHEIL